MAPELVPTAARSVAKPVTLPRRAYVTFLAGNGDYVKGVVGLAKGLRKVKTAYPLVVAVLPDVPEEHRQILESQGCIVREIVPVYPPENQTRFAMAYYVINYSKLRIWEVRPSFTSLLFLISRYTWISEPVGILHVWIQIYDVVTSSCFSPLSQPLLSNLKSSIYYFSFLFFFHISYLSFP